MHLCDSFVIALTAARLTLSLTLFPYNPIPLIEGLDSMCHNLSGGEQRSVSLGRALLSTPAILLLDEPTEGMDAHNEKVYQKEETRREERGGDTYREREREREHNIVREGETKREIHTERERERERASII